MATNGKHKEQTKDEYILKRVIGAVKLHKVGNSYMLVIPITFLAAYGERIDGEYYATINQNANTVIVTPQKQADIDKLAHMVTLNEEENKV